MAPGKLVHIQPYQLHGNFFHRDTKYRGVMHGVHAFDDLAALIELDRYYPDARKSPEFASKWNDRDDILIRERGVFTEVSADEVPEVAGPGAPLSRSTVLTASQ